MCFNVAKQEIYVETILPNFNYLYTNKISMSNYCDKCAPVLGQCISDIILLSFNQQQCSIIVKEYKMT